MTATVLQLSDTHLRSEPHSLVNGVDPDARLETVLAAWGRTAEHADLVVLTGDNADDASTAAYERLNLAVSALGSPVLALSGNHDDPRLLAEVFGPKSSAVLGSWHLVAFDTSRPNQIHGTLDVGAAMDRLDALDERPTIIAMHHPPRSRSTHAWFQLEESDELLAGLAARPHVRAVISGHLHDAFAFAQSDRLTLLGCPSTLLAIAHEGQQMEIGADASTGARVLRLEDDGTLSSTLLVA